jgi:hypothetical protein
VEYKDELRRELIELQTLLRRYGSVAIDTSGLATAIAGVMSDGPKGHDSWKYSIPTVRFRADNQRHSIPSDATDIIVDVAVSAAGLCSPVERTDPLTDLTVDILIRAYSRSRDAELFASWHLDRHAYDPADASSAHPIYHLQYGGRRIRQILIEQEVVHDGISVIVDAPRIPHPPLDGVLAIDFITSNFCGSAWKKLREDVAYCDLVARAQRRLWKPYFLTLGACWAGGGQGAWDPAALIPHLVLSNDEA